jgi:hypothetical protein
VGSKLTETEKSDLDCPLTIQELDKSIKKAKKNTAPGIDGVSNRFISRFWEFYRVPLHKYALRCFETGTLTDNFRSAKIRLIPKKGDLTNLKNWRPISLLNCFYKIISRAIATRLQKYMDKLTGIGQKGYLESKQCQEVLINIVDGISKLKHENKRGALISLDIKKAFDSTSHKYLQLVYGFFNFGPNFIKWLNLISTNRRACIILDSELCSSFFDLERGNAQGDTVSPYIFNLGFQILLFKINYDLQIEGIVDQPPIPPELPPLPREVSNRPFKIFAFADDANTLVKAEVGTLNRLKAVLEAFGKISGLECNVDKTTLLQVGTDEPLPDSVANCGFTVVEEVTVLGLTLRGPGADTVGNLTELTRKLEKQVRHWTRFNLSLPGRIAVTKTMLYSQINYLGCFMNVPTEFIDRYTAVINNFVSGNLRIAKARITKPISNGGLGLFELQSFLDAQRIAWIKRAKTLDDWWKLSLYSKSYGNVSNIRLKNCVQQVEPCQYAIVSSFEKLLVNYTKTGDNYKKVFLFENNALSLGLRNNRVVDRSLFTAQFFAEHGMQLKRLTTSEFLNDDGGFINIENFRRNTGIPLTVLTYQSLKGVIETARIRFQHNPVPGGVPVDILTFLNRARRGSKRFRKILSATVIDYIPHNIVKFSDNVDIALGIEDSKKVNTFWNMTYLSNSTRTFLFKFYNNTLGYNTAVAHFIRNHSRNCTLCDLIGNQDVEDETPLHLFYQCTGAENLVSEIFKWITNDGALEISRKEYFSFFDRREFCTEKNFILTIVSKLVLKFIWDSKQRYCLPNINHCKLTVNNELKSICAVNKKFRTMYDKSGLIELVMV